jgi:hypothetical protein
MRPLMMLLTLAACGGPSHPSDQQGPCDQVADVEVCLDGCDAVRETAAFDWGRLACLHGDDWRDLADPAEQGRGSDFQAGYAACFWEEVREGWESEGCGGATGDSRSVDSRPVESP